MPAFAAATAAIAQAEAAYRWDALAEPPRAAALLRLDPPSPALDATSVIWSFFSEKR